MGITLRNRTFCRVNRNLLSPEKRVYITRNSALNNFNPGGFFNVHYGSSYLPHPEHYFINKNKLVNTFLRLGIHKTRAKLNNFKVDRIDLNSSIMTPSEKTCCLVYCTMQIGQCGVNLAPVTAVPVNGSTPGPSFYMREERLTSLKYTLQ